MSAISRPPEDAIQHNLPISPLWIHQEGATLKNACHRSFWNDPSTIARSQVNIISTTQSDNSTAGIRGISKNSADDFMVATRGVPRNIDAGRSVKISVHFQRAAVQTRNIYCEFTCNKVSTRYAFHWRIQGGR